MDRPKDDERYPTLYPSNEMVADHLLAEGVIVPPCKVEPIINVVKKPFHNRIEVVKNTRYEWNEAQFCFSESEANGVEARWKA